MNGKRAAMKTRGIGCVVLGVVAVLVSLPLLVQAEDNVLNVYNWDDYIDEATIPAFEETFGVKVHYDVYDSNETLLAKLQAGATGFDVIFPSDYMVEIMIQLDLLEPLDKAQIPNFAHLDPQFLDQPFDPGNVYSVPYTWGTAGIGYRADQVTVPVESWGIMFDPAYAGKIVMLDDMRETIGAALKYLGYSLNTSDPQALQEAKALLIEQKGLLKAYTSAQAELFLLSGDAWLAHNWSGDVYRVAAEDPAIKYVIPQEGSSKFIDTCAIPKTAQNTALAHTFINFLLDPEVDARIHNHIRYLTPSKAALPYLDDALRTTLEQMSPEVAAKLEYIEDLGEATRLWDKIWTEIKAQ
ncbi:extracellular solute-binding protein [candidate division KSB3 bacterium]|uniref:Extracellular solute-binding protein n=1 Tax=candidate division KSB3 bacterium TaxID=2044937 RepID=A0A9D5Q6D4_9BACT|nr:extracellular solute-binding protein [candidate division KSB3 bacterium]MBD3324811.1 extracellular solute-binding protein [candidate division KSB3 bacterium]